MTIWVMQTMHDWELSCSTHLTEKGAAIAAIAAVLEFLGATDKEGAIHAMDVHFPGPDCEKPADDSLVWALHELREMPVEHLWQVFRMWAACVWDGDHALERGYNIEVNRTTLTA